MLCSNTGPPPNVALCVGGAARTFVNPLVHRSLKENLMERLGAPVTPLAFLKLNDARGDNRTGFNKLINAEEKQVRNAALAIGVAPEDLTIKRDSYNPLPQCPNYDKFVANPSSHLGSAAYYQSMLGQLENRAMCYEAMVARETRTNTTFDWLVVTRPDLTWFVERAHARRPTSVSPRLLSQVSARRAVVLARGPTVWQGSFGLGLLDAARRGADTTMDATTAAL